MRRLSWREAPYVVLDFESTGLNPARDEVIQVGLVQVRRGAVVLGSAYSSWVRPLRPFASDSVRLHGLSYELLQQAPLLDEVRGELVQLLEGRVLVAHFASLELGFLRRWGIRPPLVLDTLELALALDGVRLESAHRQAYTLSALGRRFGVGVYGEHDALADALITAQVFVRLASELEHQRGVRTVHDLARLSGQGFFLFR